MLTRPIILTITGSDNTGGAGLQADLRTIAALGGEAMTAVTAVTVQDGERVLHVMDLPTDMVLGQVRAAMTAHRPQAVKIGMVREAATVRALRSEVVGVRRLVLVPGAVSAQGQRLMHDDAVAAWRRFLLPEATLLVVRKAEAELFTGHTIATDDDLLAAACSLMDMGPQAIFLRGAQLSDGVTTALLLTKRGHRFFSTQNTAGWTRHGVGAVLSAAVTTRLGMGDEVDEAIRRAHEYVHAQVVYAVEPEAASHRPADLYNDFMTLLAAHYQEAHDVAFYASRLAITPRYLAQVTRQTVGKTPKTVMDDYLLSQAHALLSQSRLTISEVAARLGFASPAAFSKWFGAKEDISPTEYREHLSQSSLRSATKAVLS